jgi:hypothetical protein
MQNKRYNYRQAVVITENHPTLERGQIVEILREEDFCYVVQSGRTSGLEKIEKKDLSFD